MNKTKEDDCEFDGDRSWRYGVLKRRETYVCVEDGHEIDPGHQQIVSHIVSILDGRGGTEIGADGDI